MGAEIFSKEPTSAEIVRFLGRLCQKHRLRPEHLTRAHGAEPPPGHVRHDATIELIQPTGSRSYATFSLAGSPVIAELQAHDVSRPGERVQIDINMLRASVFDRETERAI